MIRRLTISLVIWRWASTHVNDDGDHCALAVGCTHNGAEVYGVAPDNRTARLFLDACDLHEYNCDHHTNYKPCIDQQPPIDLEDTTTDNPAVPTKVTKKEVLLKNQLFKPMAHGTGKKFKGQTRPKKKQNQLKFSSIPKETLKKPGKRHHIYRKE